MLRSRASGKLNIWSLFLSVRGGGQARAVMLVVGRSSFSSALPSPFFSLALKLKLDRLWIDGVQTLGRLRPDQARSSHLLP